MRHVLLVMLVACSPPATQPPPVTPATPPPTPPPAAPPSEPPEAPPANATETASDVSPIESDAPVEPKRPAGPASPGGGYGHGGGFGTITKGRYGPVLHGRVSDVKTPQPHPRERIVIRNAIKKHIIAIQACYDKALDTKPDLVGTVNATFTIEPDGQVSSATASGVDPDVATCVAAEVKTIQFPPADAKIVVNYPFAFRPPLP